MTSATAASAHVTAARAHRVIVRGQLNEPSTRRQPCHNRDYLHRHCAHCTPKRASNCLLTTVLTTDNIVKDSPYPKEIPIILCIIEL